MQRRTRRTLSLALAGTLAIAMLHTVAPSLAQRPTNPIARPRPPRPDRPTVPGRFYGLEGGGVAQAPLPGVFTVVSVDRSGNMLALRDDGGRSGRVLVDPDIFDLDELKPGDQVEVDFLVPDVGSTVIAAAAVWKLEPAKPR